MSVSTRLARTRRILWNVLLDLRYGSVLGGSVNTSYANKGANETANTSYEVLARIFPTGTVQEEDVLVDVGCGKGRVLNWWLSRGYRNKMIGIELDPNIAEQTRRRLRRYSNVSIVTGDAMENLPVDGTIFYLYNPFQSPVLRTFCDRLADSSENLRDVRIFYFHPTVRILSVFENDPRWEVVERRHADRLWAEGDFVIVRPTMRRRGGRGPLNSNSGHQ